jgi:hypothetical protein
VKPPAFKFNNGSQKIAVIEETAVNSVEDNSPIVNAEQDLHLEFSTD